MTQLFRVLFAGLFALGIAACTTVGEPRLPPASDAASGSSVLVDSYHISVGDVVQVNVWKNPELSISEPVRPDGRIAVPLIGDVAAANKTPEELSAEITKKLSRYVKNPKVTVLLTSLQGHAFLSRIRVTGAVGNDISIPYAQGMTVLDAVLEAGSLDLYADGNNTKLHRRTADGGVVTYDIRLKDIMEDGDMKTNVTLLPGDIITVPERMF